MNKDDENYIYYVFGQNLKRCRIDKGLTQRKLAELSHYDISFIKNLESKVVYQTASLGTVYHFSIVLDIHITELLRDLEEE